MPYTISHLLIDWYHTHHRTLPWRETTDPYLIWISEVILQQTRVAQGLDYFNRFVARFPNVMTLAEADQDEVLKYWQGLGYYSRARSLHSAAQDVMVRFGGEFPRTHAEVLSLKGVGDYTAAAICSFAYHQPYATLDGNVYRVLSRLFALELPIDSTTGKKQFANLSQAMLNPAQPHLHNQAMMEFGALQCTPKSPDCPSCPLCDRCLALQQGSVERLPIKGSKTTVTNRYFNYLHIRHQAHTLLQQRTEQDIWQNLYELPLIETDEAVTFEVLQQSEAFRTLFAGATGVTVGAVKVMPKHLLSHRAIYARFYEITVDALSPEMQKKIMVPDDDLDRYAISRLTDRYLLHDH